MEQLTGQVWLGEVEEAPQMHAAGVTCFVDLRTDSGPPIEAANTEKFPLERSAPDGDDTLAWAARCVKMRVDQGEVVGICGHGQKGAAEALGMAYLMAVGYSLEAAQAFWRNRWPGMAPSVPSWPGEDIRRRLQGSKRVYSLRTIAGLSLHTVHCPGPGDPLVLLHGAYGSWTHWVNNLESLSQFADVWAMDLPGFGESDDWPGEFDSTKYVQVVASAIRDLVGKPVVLAGYSFGAFIAAALALAAPDQVQSLVLVSLVGQTGDPALHRRIEERHFSRNPSWQYRLGVVRDNLRALHLYRREAADARTVRMTYLNILHARLGPRELRRGSPRMAMADMLRGLRSVPVMMCWGRHDPMPQPSVEAWAQTCQTLIPDAEIRIVDGASHWCQYEQPHEITELIREFLGSGQTAGTESTAPPW